MTNSVFPYLCPKCNRQYAGIGTSKQVSSVQYPLIIKCGHTLCKSCIETAARLDKSIVCSICEEKTELPDGQKSVDSLLSDLYILGRLSVPDQNFRERPKKEKDTSKLNLQSSSSNNVTCDECSQRSAVWRCDRCVAHYCNICFDYVHKSSRVMKKHEAKPILVESYRRKVQEGCADHDQRPIEFFCQDDNELACSYCVVLNDSKHKGHSLILLSEKNKSCMDDLKLGIEEGKKVQSKLHKTEKYIARLLPESNTVSNKLLNQVYEQFHMLHSLLQLREIELISQLEEISNQNLEKLEYMHHTISQHHKELSSVLQDAEQAMENSLISMNIVDVVKKLLSVKELPCYLVPVTTEQTDEVKIHFNPDFQDMIKSYGKIEAFITPKYTLRNESEIPPGFEDDIIEEIPTDTESVTSRSESFSEDIPDISVLSQKPNSSKTIKEDNVFVTHIQNPSNFWVQKLNDSRKMKGLTDSINKWCYSSESSKCIPLSLKIGELYLVLYNEDKVWYRARVKKIFDLSDDDVIFSSELSPFEEKIQQLKLVLSPGQEILAYVYYIDFGNTDVVPISNMRTMQTRFLHLPGLAINCALWDLVPANNEKEWSISAIKTFASLVGNKELMMVVIENRNDILHVDLCQPCSQTSGIKNDVPISIRDALVFMEVGCFVSGNILEKQKLRAYIHRAKRRQFYPPEPLAIGKKLSVLLSHVVNPQHFYVQQMGGNARYLSNLIFEMQSSYNSSGSDHLIVAPEIGMICVAQYSLDKQWYRAQIISLPGSAKVEVFYVDFGNTEILPYKKLRKIADDYIKLPCQAVKCALVDIAPVDGNEWSNKATTWFTEAAGKKTLSVKVHKVIPREGTNQVILYHVKENSEICINGLIVKEGIAISTGNESCIIEIPRDIPPRKVSEEKFEHINKVKSSNTKNNEDAPFIIPSKPPPKPKSEDKKGYIAVNISYVETPDCIFFHLAKQKQQLEEMMEKLQEVYGQSETSEIEIEENKTYAVLNPSDKRWYRACVHKINDNKSCLVQFLDFGVVSTVTQDKIQVLLPMFQDILVFAVPCNLSGIIPAGGKKWSYIACETLKSLLLPTDSIYVQKKGNIVDGLLPVDLFIKEIHSGALEVTSVEYRSVTEMLIEKGVALPAETRRRNTSPKIEEFKKSSKSTIENASKSEIKSLSSITTNPSQSPSPSPTENLTSLQVTTNMTVTVNQKENEKKIDDINAWKPAPAPTKNVFYGVPTHVGEDGCIYLQPEGETVKNNLLLIKNALKLKYENIENEPAKSYPSVGQACAAKFYLDNCWHRAVVTKVNPPNIQVTFVDYGNSENVKLENIHLDIVLSDIPRQCIECILHGVEPKTENGEWLTSTLDFIHNNIVERKCKVVVMDQPLPDKRIPIKLFCNDVDITKMIVEVGHAKLKNQIESQEEKQPHNPISKQNNEAAVTTKVKPVLPFETAILPVVGTLFPVVVTQVFSFDAICIQKLRIDNPETDHEEAINEEYDKFLLMMADLSQNAECFPQLENIDIGMACCGMYTYDDNWYRCIVTNKVNDDVLVTYVDYGNSEVIPIKRLRELPIKYFALPQQAIGCKLSGIKPVGGEWTDEIVSKMEMKLFPKDGNLIAKINKWDETPEISLFVENFEGVTVLAYQNLIDEGLIEIEEDI